MGECSILLVSVSLTKSTTNGRICYQDTENQVDETEILTCDSTGLYKDEKWICLNGDETDQHSSDFC